ncbi:MAG: hypothetical protein P4L85_15330 [Paludisphaera borealis]|uniref:hypothetical protein n=1 Tax=Paludisphaera borealis TaxID=1387353 RepID=UPI00284CF469|nr:hypothetical protein [Paludisphaera borealis]MDR3620723.1 hypothetical protein [Paludisphaera borealis]
MDGDDRRRRGLRAPSVEALEGRTLLSGYSGMSRMRNVATNTGVYQLQLSGPGFLKVQQLPKGVIDLNLLGTTSGTTLTVALLRPRPHKIASLLPIQDLNVVSRQLGAINASSALLSGAMSPLANSVSQLSFGALGPAAQIDVNGGVALMTVPEIDLGPTGHVVISGDLNSGSTTPMQIDDMTIDGGRFVIGRDSVTPITISGDLTLGQNGLLSIGRDQLAPITVGGTVRLEAGGEILVGRNLFGLHVVGDVIVNPGASGILVRGSIFTVPDPVYFPNTVYGLIVDGVFQGQGSATAVDLGVGLDLDGFEVRSGTENLGGLQSANVNVGKNITNLYIAHGIFRSWITSGAIITNITIGPDVPTAIYNSEIDAVMSINNVSALGDVKSDFPTNAQATGYPTRIIAGKSRDGTFQANGQLNNVQINGSLIDSVLAASVAPFGGDGTLPPPVPYGGVPRTAGPPPAGFSNYNAPGGITQGGDGSKIKNYSIRSFVGGQALPVAVYDTATDPNIHVTVLDGGVVTASVSGSVISSPHDDRFDYTGVFALNTAGVDGGLSP